MDTLSSNYNIVAITNIAVVPKEMANQPSNQGTFQAAKRPQNRVRCYLELCKPRLSLLVVLTTVAGFVLASGGSIDLAKLAWVSLGTFFAAAGINALNQWAERGRDCLMLRTKRRPLPSKSISVRNALAYAIAISLLGNLLLFVFANPLTAALSLFTQLVYVGIYTPLKTRNPFCTIAGAICGAVPPMMGWSAVTGGLGGGAWVLGALLFAWQIPHFLALAWMYRDDYKLGGFLMLPSLNDGGRMTFRMLMLYSLSLLPLGLAATLLGLAGTFYAFLSLLLGGVMVVLGYRLSKEPTQLRAKRVFLASIIYLPLLLGAMVADRIPALDNQRENQQIAAVSTASTIQAKFQGNNGT